MQGGPRGAQMRAAQRAPSWRSLRSVVTQVGAARWGADARGAAGSAGTTPAVTADAGRASWAADASSAVGSLVQPVTGAAGTARWGTDARAAAGSLVQPVSGDAGRARWGTDASGATGSLGSVAPVTGAASRASWGADARSAAGSTVTTVTGSAGRASWGVDATGAAGSVQLVLASFDDSGLDVLVKMLVEAGGSGTTIYRAGINGTLLTGSDDDLTSGIQINRLRWIDSLNRWRVNRFGTDSLGAYLSGDGSDLSLTIQTAESTVELTVADDWLTSTGAAVVNFDVDDAGARSVLAGISSGDRFIFAMWQRSAVSGDAGGAGWLTDARGATGSAGTTPPVIGDAGRARWAADARGAAGSAGVTPAVSGDAGRVRWAADASGAAGSAGTTPAVSGDAGRAAWATGARDAVGSAGTVAPVTGAASRAGWGADARAAAGSLVQPVTSVAGRASWAADARGAAGSTGTVAAVAGTAGIARWGTDGRAAAGSTVTAVTGSAGTARWGADARDAAGSLGTALLTLASFDDSGLDVLVKMLVEAGGSGANIYRSGVSGTLLTGSDDDLTSGLQINRFRWIASDNRWRINRVGADSLSTYLAGDGSDLSLTIQTADATVDLTVTDDWVTSTGVGGANFDVDDADGRAVLAGIADGDRFIFAMWQPVPVSGDAGRASWGADARGAAGSAGTTPPVSGDAGYARWGADAGGAAGTALSQDTALSVLSLNVEGLTPIFDSSTLSYTLNVPAGIGNVMIMALAEGVGATVSFAPSSTVPLHPGANAATITVTAAGGDTRTYSITITRARLAIIHGAAAVDAWAWEIDGERTELSEDPYTVIDFDRMGMPDPDITRTALPFGGSRITHVRFGERDCSLSLRIRARSAIAAHDAAEALMSKLFQQAPGLTVRQGDLVHTRYDGTERRLKCVLKSGLMLERQKLADADPPAGAAHVRGVAPLVVLVTPLDHHGDPLE